MFVNRRYNLRNIRKTLPIIPETREALSLEPRSPNFGNFSFLIDRDGSGSSDGLDGASAGQDLPWDGLLMTVRKWTAFERYAWPE